jgi:3-hydroxyacyl-[acyl-carrier-protein] dehydratase
MSDESAAMSPEVSDLPAPADVIAHRPPFLFVDELLEVVPGERARGRWHLTGDEWFFAGHFPGRPTLPGVLMAEAIAQLGAIAVLTDERFVGKLRCWRPDGARFRRQVGPGDVLRWRSSQPHVGPCGKGIRRLSTASRLRVRPHVRPRRRVGAQAGLRSGA